jgi:DNA-binding NtrC family response regulator
MSATILVCDDDSVPRRNIASVLEEEGYTVHQAEDGKAAIDAINQIDFDLVLTDLKMPGVDGLSVLKHVRSISPQTLVILMTAFSSVDTAVEAFRLGAQDYILKPIVIEDVIRKVGRFLEHKNLVWEVEMLRREINRSSEPTSLVGSSKPIQDIFKIVSKVAATNSTVLITGESGSARKSSPEPCICKACQRTKYFCQ